MSGSDAAWMTEKSVAVRKEDCLVVEIIPACDNQRKLVLLRGLKTEAIHFFHFSPSVSRQPLENLFRDRFPVGPSA